MVELAIDERYLGDHRIGWQDVNGEWEIFLGEMPFAQNAVSYWHDHAEAAVEAHGYDGREFYGATPGPFTWKTLQDARDALQVAQLATANMPSQVVIFQST